jgi:putative endonuclease
MAAKDELGKRGEALAAEHLVARGYAILERNWRCAIGEIDIVALDADEVVFVEVKTRTSVTFGHPFEAITSVKLARMRRLATAWCEAHPESRRHVRIDVVAIIAPTHGLIEIEHLQSVFQ